MLQALRAAFAADVRGGIALLRRALASSKTRSSEAPYVRDVLAAYSMSTGDFAALRSLCNQRFEDMPAILEASHMASLAMLDAADGNVVESRSRAREAIRRSLEHDPPLVRGRVLSRCAIASYYLADYESASERALESAVLYEGHEAHSAAATSYSIPATIAHSYRHDGALAMALYEKMLAHAERAEHNALRRTAVAALFCVASERYDVAACAKARTALLRDPAPQQHQESTVIVIAEALGHGWRGEFTTASAILRAPDASQTRSDHDDAHLRALRSIIAIARWDYDEARSLARTVLSERLALRTLPLHHAARRTHARIIAAFASFAIGDQVRAQRALTKAVDPDGRYRELLTTDSIVLDRCPELFRGYAAFINAALERARELRPGHGLTAAEVSLVRALPQGHTVRELAEQLGKSKHTIARQLESIYAKLGARNRTQAIHQARERGLLP